jgi:hypothetical protein
LRFAVIASVAQQFTSFAQAQSFGGGFITSFASGDLLYLGGRRSAAITALGKGGGSDKGSDKQSGNGEDTHEKNFLV